MKAMNEPLGSSFLGERLRIRWPIILSVGVVIALVYWIFRGPARETSRQTLLRSVILEGPAPTEPQPAPEYHLVIEVPKPGTYRPQEEIDVRASITLSEGQKPPASAQVLIRRRGVNLNSASLEAKKGDEPAALVLEGKIKLPKEPGPVDVVVNAVEMKSYQQKGRDSDVRVRTVSSTPLKISVGR
jgi:hypothetical protein